MPSRSVVMNSAMGGLASTSAISLALYFSFGAC
jgi:hypothetical protein